MSLLDRLRRRRAAPAPVLVDDGTLVVVGECFDPARADSAVVSDMARAGVDVGHGTFVLRHVLRLPGPDAVAEAVRVLGPDGWTVTEVPGGAGVVHVSRQQEVTGLAIARERGRMAGFAQRLGGDADGWQVLAPPGPPSGTQPRR